MAYWARRKLLQVALACVSTSLVVLNKFSRNVFAQSCSPPPVYYDPYDPGSGCDAQQIFDGTCFVGGGDSGGGGGDGGDGSILTQWMPQSAAPSGS